MLFVKKSRSAVDASPSLINSAERNSVRSHSSSYMSSGVDSAEIRSSCPVRESNPMSSLVPLPTDLSLSESVSPNLSLIHI